MLRPHAPPRAAILAMALAACADGPIGPAAGSAPPAGDITVRGLATALDTAPARVEIKLLPGGLVAREIERRTPDEMAHRESVRAPVTAIAAGGGSGTLTLALGGLEVRFGPDTRLRNEDGDVSFDAFVAEIEAAQAAGLQPFVRAARPAALPPQAPGDPSFLADEIRIRDVPDDPEIELNVDADNLSVSDASPREAILTVLGLAVEIRAGVTQVEDENGHEDGNDDVPGPGVEFAAAVTAVVVADGAVTLAGGATVRLTDATVIETDGDLPDLRAVADAVAGGRPVRAEGRGTVETAGPPATWVAATIKFEVDD